MWGLGGIRGTGRGGCAGTRSSAAVALEASARSGVCHCRSSAAPRGEARARPAGRVGGSPQNRRGPRPDSQLTPRLRPVPSRAREPRQAGGASGAATGPGLGFDQRTAPTGCLGLSMRSACSQTGTRAGLPGSPFRVKVHDAVRPRRLCSDSTWTGLSSPLFDVHSLCTSTGKWKSLRLQRPSASFTGRGKSSLNTCASGSSRGSRRTWELR